MIFGYNLIGLDIKKPLKFMIFKGFLTKFDLSLKSITFYQLVLYQAIIRCCQILSNILPKL